MLTLKERIAFSYSLKFNQPKIRIFSLGFATHIYAAPCFAGYQLKKWYQGSMARA